MAVPAQHPPPSTPVAFALEAGRREGTQLLHDIWLPGVDHLVIAPSGVWVVGVHHDHGRIELRKPLFAPASLRIGEQDRTTLVRELDEQAAVIEKTVQEHLPGTPVRGVLCLPDADLPHLGTLSLDGTLLLSPKALVRRVNGSGGVSAAEARALAALLGSRLALAPA